MMHSPATLGYFSAPSDHYWSWEEDEESRTAVWTDTGETLIFRAQLLAVLEALAPQGLPPLGSLFLVLAAAQDGWDPDKMEQRIIETANELTGYDDPPQDFTEKWKNAARGLQLVHDLEVEHRKGGASIPLLEVVFDSAFNRLPPSLSAEILQEFRRTPTLTPFQERTPELNGLARLMRDIVCLAKVFQNVTARGLENRLLTGLDLEISPEPEVELVDPETQLGHEPHLFEALEKEGGELAQIAAIARQLSAVLHVPKPMLDEDDLPVGGVSDITNRGEPNRLLLTELAWDDITFAARLAHGEALYSRRESPPAEPPPGRTILLDSGIHLWGKPKLFGLGAALALQQAPSDSTTKLFCRNGNEWKLTTLDSASSVRDQLGNLEPSPDPTKALESWWQTFAGGEELDGEVFVIMHPESMKPVQRANAWGQLARDTRLHAVQVNREGHLILSRYRPMGPKVISEVMIDLEKLIRSKEPKKLKSLTNDEYDLPTFYRCEPWPLYDIRLANSPYSIPNGGFIGLSNSGYLCSWGESKGAGRILLPNLFGGTLMRAILCRGREKRVGLVFICGSRIALIITSIDSNPPYLLQIIPDDVANEQAIVDIRFEAEAVIVAQPSAVHAYDSQTGRELASLKNLKIHHTQCWFDGEQFHADEGSSLGGSISWLSQSKMTGATKRKHLSGITEAGFGKDGELILARGGGWGYTLKELSETNISWESFPGSAETLIAFEDLDLPEFKPQGLRQAIFPNGTRIVADPRGFLHVMDDGAEFSIVLVKGATAVWEATTGRYYGERNLLFDEEVHPVTGLLAQFPKYLHTTKGAAP